MLTSSQLFALGGKVLGLTAIAVILFPANVALGITEQQGGEQQVESDGELTVTLNGDSFRRGDTVTVSGIVGERGHDSNAMIYVTDPLSETVQSGLPSITLDNTFTYSFEADMEGSGNYLILVRYWLPGDTLENEEVELVFEYDATTTTTADTAESEAAAGPTTTTFQSITDGFRIQVPNGWVVEDVNSTESWVQQGLRQYGIEYLAAMCPQNQASPLIGGLYSCPMQTSTAMAVEFFRFVDLQTRPELAVLALENKSITTSDLLALFIQQQQIQNPQSLQNLEIVNNTDIAVNVIDPVTNKTIGTVPAKYAEYIYTNSLGRGSYKEFVLLVLSNDTNTGYVVLPVIREGLESDREAPSFVRQVLGSFELVTSLTTPLAATSTPSPPQGQSQQQQGVQDDTSTSSASGSISDITNSTTANDQALRLMQ